MDELNLPDFARLKPLLDAMATPVVITDADKKIVYYNAAFAVFSGLRPRALRDGVACLVCRGGVSGCVADRCRESGQPISHGEVPITLPTGEAARITVVGMPLRDAQGRPTGVLVDNATTLVEVLVPPLSAAELREALPRVVDALIESGLRQRIRVVASGKLITSARAAWALCVGADFVNTARGFMFALGCIQALRCHQNTCPTGVTTHNRRLQRALVVQEKFQRVANYCINMNREIDMIAHSCGVRHARELRREHVRIVQANHQSIALNMLYPYPEPVARVKAA